MSVTSLAPSVTIDEYLRTSYRPDCDYVDDHVEERTVGEREHSRVQLFLSSLFFRHEQEWHVYTLPEQRVQVSITRFRVPDLCVLRSDQPREPIVHQPPLICIEILSPDDSYRTMHERVTDYLRMGVENVWLFDPFAREGLVCLPTGWNQPHDGRLVVPGTDIVIDLNEFYVGLD
jgi:Uma2 family endonuclease